MWIPRLEPGWSSPRLSKRCSHPRRTNPSTPRWTPRAVNSMWSQALSTPTFSSMENRVSPSSRAAGGRARHNKIGCRVSKSETHVPTAGIRARLLLARPRCRTTPSPDADGARKSRFLEGTGHIPVRAFKSSSFYESAGAGLSTLGDDARRGARPGDGLHGRIDIRTIGQAGISLLIGSGELCPRYLGHPPVAVRRVPLLWSLDDSIEGHEHS
jgi:hypothetical protein